MKIEDDEQYWDAVRQLKELWLAREGTPQWSELDRLATAMDAYEQERFDVLRPREGTDESDA
jgi:hypothetical protein